MLGVGQDSLGDLRQGIFLSTTDFFCVQLRCNTVCCAGGESFVFLVINRQPWSYPAWLLSLRVPLEGPSWHIVLLLLRDCLLLVQVVWAGGRDCSSPCALFSACCPGSLQEIMPDGRGGGPSQTQPALHCPHSLSYTYLMKRSHYPGRGSC